MLLQRKNNNQVQKPFLTPMEPRHPWCQDVLHVKKTALSCLASRCHVPYPTMFSGRLW